MIPPSVVSSRLGLAKNRHWPHIIDDFSATTKNTRSTTCDANSMCITILIFQTSFDVLLIGSSPILVSHRKMSPEAPVLSVGLFGLTIETLTRGLLANRFGRQVIAGAISLFV